MNAKRLFQMQMAWKKLNENHPRSEEHTSELQSQR